MGLVVEVSNLGHRAQSSTRRFVSFGNFDVVPQSGRCSAFNTATANALLTVISFVFSVMIYIGFNFIFISNFPNSIFIYI